MFKSKVRHWNCGLNLWISGQFFFLGLSSREPLGIKRRCLLCSYNTNCCTRNSKNTEDDFEPKLRRIAATTVLQSQPQQGEIYTRLFQT